MTSQQIRAARIERTASLDDTLRAMLEIMQEIAAQLAEANEREAGAGATEWHEPRRRHSC
jgi:hypothetical protein